jgi:hypothetical protein
MPRHSYRHHLSALLGFSILTLLMTYPLVRDFGRAIPGDGFDGWQNVWNLWWAKRALLIDGINPYFTRFVDYPDGVQLYFHTLNIFNGLTFLPFTLNSGTLVAYNVAVVFSFVVGGYGAYLLALYVMRQASPGRRSLSSHAHMAAFLGGVVFTFAPYHTAHLLGHMQLISLEWLPFYALLVVKQIDKYRIPNLKSQTSGLLRYALIAAVFLVLVAACDWYYAFYMVLFTGLYLLWAIWRRRVWQAPTLSVLAIGLLFVLVTSPLLVPMVREALTADYMVPPRGSTERLSADLTAFLTPSELHPLWGELAARWANRFTASVSERTVFAGYSVLGLSLLSLLTQWRSARFWALSTLFFALMSLGPVLHVGGATQFGRIGPVPLPYALLHRAIPLLRISRSVSRFDVMVMLSLGVMAAIGLNWLLNRAVGAGYNGIASRLIAVGALAGVGLEFWVAPYPMSLPETRSFHYQLAKEPGSFAVMDIPMDWDRPANLLYQTVHQKPTVSGYTSRTNPQSPAWRTPVLDTFRYMGPDINSGQPRALAPSVLTDLDVRYVIVHKTDLPPGDYRRHTLDTVDEVFGDWPVVVDDDWLSVFRVPQPAPPVPYLVLGQGWGTREWRNGGPRRTLVDPVATILARLPSPDHVSLELVAYSLAEPVSLELQLDGELIGTYAVSYQPATIITPEISLPAGENVIQIRVDQASGAIVFTRVSLGASQ